MKKTVCVLVLAVVAALASASGCSSSPDCVSLCQQSQVNGCEINSGSCADYCAAAEQVAGEAGCPDALDNYLTCVSDGPVCGSADRCASQYDTAYGCYVGFCGSNPNDDACKEIGAQS